MKACIHSFESLAALDGAGLRYALFMAGCPLRCIYCHNPDTWQLGEATVTSDELIRKIIRYKPYFKDNGGVTFTGGEPLMQAAFIREMVPLLQEQGISYVIDTSGGIPLSKDIKFVLERAEMVILDLKFWDEESYHIYTGTGIQNVLDTADYLNSIGKKMWIRTVVVPNINDTEAVISRYLPYVKNWSCVGKYEILGFHTMGFYKYEALSLENPLHDTPPLSDEAKIRLQTFVNRQLGLQK